MNARRRLYALAAAMAISVLALAGCGAQINEQLEQELGGSSVTEQQSSGGVLIIRINPEIAITYDAQGMVTAVEGRNDDGRALVSDDSAFVGLTCRDAVSQLVAQIKDAGYLVEEVEGEGNNIVIEVEHGSVLPSDNFLNGIVTDTETYLGQHRIPANIEVHGESAYGWDSYHDSDYGPDSDGATDYHMSDYGTTVDDTDYGPNNDGVTDYNGSASGNASNYGGDSNYGNAASGSGGNSNYSDSSTNYNSNYGSGSSSPAPTPTPDPAPAPTPDPAPSGGNSNYGDSSYGGNSDSDNGNSGYDSGNSGYDSNNSGYGGSSGDDGNS